MNLFWSGLTESFRPFIAKVDSSLMTTFDSILDHNYITGYLVGLGHDGINLYVAIDNLIYQYSGETTTILTTIITDKTTAWTDYNLGLSVDKNQNLIYIDRNKYTVLAGVSSIIAQVVNLSSSTNYYGIEYVNDTIITTHNNIQLEQYTAYTSTLIQTLAYSLNYLDLTSDGTDLYCIFRAHSVYISPAHIYRFGGIFSSTLLDSIYIETSSPSALTCDSLERMIGIHYVYLNQTITFNQQAKGYTLKLSLQDTLLLQDEIKIVGPIKETQNIDFQQSVSVRKNTGGGIGVNDTVFGDLRTIKRLDGQFNSTILSTYEILPEYENDRVLGAIDTDNIDTIWNNEDTSFTTYPRVTKQEGCVTSTILETYPTGDVLIDPIRGLSFIGSNIVYSTNISDYTCDFEIHEGLTSSILDTVTGFTKLINSIEPYNSDFIVVGTDGISDYKVYILDGFSTTISSTYTYTTLYYLGPSCATLNNEGNLILSAGTNIYKVDGFSETVLDTYSGVSFLYGVAEYHGGYIYGYIITLLQTIDFQQSVTYLKQDLAPNFEDNINFSAECGHNWKINNINHFLDFVQTVDVNIICLSDTQNIDLEQTVDVHYSKRSVSLSQTFNLTHITRHNQPRGNFTEILTFTSITRPNIICESIDEDLIFDEDVSEGDGLFNCVLTQNIRLNGSKGIYGDGDELQPTIELEQDLLFDIVGYDTEICEQIITIGQTLTYTVSNYKTNDLLFTDTVSSVFGVRDHVKQNNLTFAHGCVGFIWNKYHKVSHMWGVTS